MGEARERIRAHKRILDSVRQNPAGRKKTQYTNLIMLWLYENTELQFGKIAKLLGFGNSVMTRFVRDYDPLYVKETHTDKDNNERIPHRAEHALTDDEFGRLLTFVKALNQTS